MTIDINDNLKYILKEKHCLRVQIYLLFSFLPAIASVYSVGVMRPTYVIDDFTIYTQTFSLFSSVHCTSVQTYNKRGKTQIGHMHVVSSKFYSEENLM